MSRHQRRQRYRLRRRRVYLRGQLATACYWIWRLTEFPKLLQESPHLQHMLHNMRRAKITYLDALADVGQRVESARYVP